MCPERRKKHFQAQKEKEKSEKDVFDVLKRIQCVLLILALLLAVAIPSALADTGRVEITNIYQAGSDVMVYVNLYDKATNNYAAENYSEKSYTLVAETNNGQRWETEGAGVETITRPIAYTVLVDGTVNNNTRIQISNAMRKFVSSLSNEELFEICYREKVYDDRKFNTYVTGEAGLKDGRNNQTITGTNYADVKPNMFAALQEAVNVIGSGNRDAQHVIIVISDQDSNAGVFSWHG